MLVRVTRAIAADVCVFYISRIGRKQLKMLVEPVTM